MSILLGTVTIFYHFDRDRWSSCATKLAHDMGHPQRVQFFFGAPECPNFCPNHLARAEFRRIFGAFSAWHALDLAHAFWRKTAQRAGWNTQNAYRATSRDVNVNIFYATVLRRHWLDFNNFGCFEKVWTYIRAEGALRSLQPMTTEVWIQELSLHVVLRQGLRSFFSQISWVVDIESSSKSLRMDLRDCLTMPTAKIGVKGRGPVLSQNTFFLTKKKVFFFFR